MGKSEIEMTIPLFGAKMTYELNMNKQFELPTTLFVEMSSFDIEILSATATSMVASTTSSFFSSSVLEMINIGRMVFDITDVNEVPLGQVEISNFEARRDFNRLDNVLVTMNVNEDQSNALAISKFLATFANGVDQVIQMYGPVESVAPFMSHIVTQNITVKGAKVVDHLVASEMVIQSSTADSISAVATVSLYSGMEFKVAPVTVDGKPLILEMIYEGVKIGEGVLDQDIPIGPSTMQLSSVLRAESDEALKKVLMFLNTFA
jgi:hypothetical protein